MESKHVTTNWIAGTMMWYQIVKKNNKGIIIIIIITESNHQVIIHIETYWYCNFDYLIITIWNHNVQ